MFRAALVLWLSLIALPTSAATYTFSQRFFNEIDPAALSGTLNGSFAGTDLNSNGQLEANEFTAFAAAWDEVVTPGILGDFTLGLDDLSSFSFFRSPTDFVLNATRSSVTPPGVGFNSSGVNNLTQVGESTSRDEVSTLYTAGRVTIAAIPEPGSLALLTASLMACSAFARGRAKR
jgi:hypothetical protein